MSLNLTRKVTDYLRANPERKFKAREIAEWVFATYPEECREKQERSVGKRAIPLDTDAALIQQIVAEIGAHRSQLLKNQKIKTTEERPRKYYYTESADDVEVDHAESSELSPASATSEPALKEHDLYPILTEFLWSELAIYGKRIDERRSRNARGAGGNRWLYPDLVGMEDLSGEWHREIKDCAKEYSDKKTKLWSFEVKILINRSNVREAFFQAVSNSSWANFGYLVASEIAADTSKELRMLAGLHGIGVIQLNTEDPSESQIMIPARERSEVDWDTANRLTEENKDFLDYIKLIRQFYQTGEARQSDWDMKTDGGFD